MSQLVAIRALSRQRIRVVNSDGNKVSLSQTSDTIVDLDNPENRRALARHHAIGQYVVSAANASAGPAGTKTALAANA